MSFATPILFIAFNRPESTQLVFDEIRKARPKQLFIAIDGPRPNHQTDEIKSVQVKSIVQKVDWICDVRTLHHERNLGCGNAVKTALNWFFSQVEEGIILEDDCLPHSDFFLFCSEMLHHYRYDDRVLSINGSNLGFHGVTDNSYFFSRFMNMWGWATWRRSAVQIDYEMTSWSSIPYKEYQLSKLLSNSLFDFDLRWIKLWKLKFDMVFSNPGFTWDWQWIWFQLRHKKLSVVPSSNLVENIGFNAAGTHTVHSSHSAASIPSQKLQKPLMFRGDYSTEDRYEDQYIKQIWCEHISPSKARMIADRLNFLFRSKSVKQK